MFTADLYQNGVGGRIVAYPGREGFCPLCHRPVIAKCGQIVSWHWAHETSDDCDPWHEPETEWHQNWKRFAMEHGAKVEVVFGDHRADAVHGRRVWEFQGSTIPMQETCERETFYLEFGYRVGWVMDAAEAHISGRLEVRDKSDHVTFVWKHGPKSLLRQGRDLIFDLGSRYLMVKRLYEAQAAQWHENWASMMFYEEKASPAAGWGRLVERASLFPQGKA